MHENSFVRTFPRADQHAYYVSDVLGREKVLCTVIWHMNHSNYTRLFEVNRKRRTEQNSTAYSFICIYIYLREKDALQDE